MESLSHQDHLISNIPSPTPISPSSPLLPHNHHSHSPSQSHYEPFDFDDRGYDYLDEPNQNLICPICRNPFVDPVMCESSDHIFCRLCLIRALEHSSTCPIDRLPLSLSLVVPAPKIVFRLVDELLVRCPYRAKRGCRFVCPRDLVAAHVSSNVCQPLPVTPPPPTLPPSCLDDPPDPASVPPSLPLGPLPPPPLPLSHPQPRPSSSSQAHCPYQRFGCPYVGPASQLSETHLRPPADGLVCRFASVAPLLDAYAALERCNADLRAQLAHVLAQRDELGVVAAGCEARLRQLWLAHSPPPGGLVGGCMSPVRRSSDSALHTSRMNYDGVNGCRVAGTANGLPLSKLGSSAVRVSSFVRRGGCVTPVEDRPQGSLKHTALPKIVTSASAAVVEQGCAGGAREIGHSEHGLRQTIGELVGALYASLERIEAGGGAGGTEVEGDVRGVLGRMAEVWKQMGSNTLQARLAERDRRTEEGSGAEGEFGVGSSGGSRTGSDGGGTGSGGIGTGQSMLISHLSQQQQQRVTSMKL